MTDQPCTCECLKPQTHLEPAEWEQNPYCAQHGDSRMMADRIGQLEKENATLKKQLRIEREGPDASEIGHDGRMVDALHLWQSAVRGIAPDCSLFAAEANDERG